MDAASRVLDRGRLIISKGKIAAVLAVDEPIPEAYAQTPEIDTGASLYPGLIDLHNHLPYNIMPLWRVPKHFDNRAQWQRHPDYRPSVSEPVVALAGIEATAKAIARYVEAKAMVGGVTTGQGMRMIERGAARHFVGAMRNVENTDDLRLPEAATMVLDLNANQPDKVETFRRNLARAKAFLYHLAEGIDDASRQRFQDLRDHDLLASSLVGIHSLALRPEDLAALAAAGGKVVWSPLSNLLLYGQTQSVAALLQSGITFCLGCDWSPSGSKNLLFELKVAQWTAREQGVALTDRQLVELVTSTAAATVGWTEQLGRLQPGMLADVVAVKGETNDPYAHLIAARERAMALVIIHGQPRYGDQDLMEQLLPMAAVTEDVQIDGALKRFHLHAPQSTINDLTLRTATERLATALSDLPAFLQENSREELAFRAESARDSVHLLLDMETEGEAPLAFIDAPIDELRAQALTLDALETDTEQFWQTLEAEPNLPAGMAAALRGFYR